MAAFLIKMKYNLILYRPPCEIFKTSENAYNNLIRHNRLTCNFIGKVSCDRSIGEEYTERFFFKCVFGVRYGKFPYIM